jgi:hypothetical protein
MVYVILATGLLLAWTGCSSPASRISHSQSEFNAYPSDIQAKIRAGEVAVGFTAPQVRMALGDPDRIVTRTTTAGASEVWIYGGGRSGLGFGFGLGLATGGSSGVGAGVGTSSGGAEEKLRLVLNDGRVTAVEQPVK